MGGGRLCWYSIDIVVDKCLCGLRRAVEAEGGVCGLLASACVPLGILI
jgi:hypothetical protein